VYFVSAPFGNYLQYTNFLSGNPIISVTGTFTLKPRPGLAKQIIKTLRYTKTGWRNALGLRNPGIFEGIDATAPRNVMSIASLQPNDWKALYEIVPKHMNLELNISCPNVDEHPNLIKSFAKDERKWCIVKVPPNITNKQLDKVVKLGYNQIHASNTVPTAKGGLSGDVIVPHTLRILEYIKSTHPHVEVIAGGGVKDKDSANRYLDAGADHISLGTVCITPWRIKSIIA
jgi:dihydroorotate dehydrogenase|tara:strand:+ start:175 stop:864 length:690 start_codon:yes stop_codon:yes gene_type:complete